MSKMTFHTWFALEYNVHTLHLVEVSFKSLLIYNDPLICFSCHIFVKETSSFVLQILPHSGCGRLRFPGGNVSSVPHSLCLPVWGSLKFRSLFTTTVFHGWMVLSTSCCIRSGRTSCLCESLSVPMELTVTSTLTLPISFSLRVGAATEDHCLALLFHEGWQNYVTVSYQLSIRLRVPRGQKCLFLLSSLNIYICLLNEWTNISQLHC